MGKRDGASITEGVLLWARTQSHLRDARKRAWVLLQPCAWEQDMLHLGILGYKTEDRPGPGYSFISGGILHQLHDAPLT